MKLSIVMPVLDEARRSRPLCERWRLFAQRGVEVIVADGGSSDGTPERARPLADHVIAAPRGRAAQMNAGAAAARATCSFPARRHAAAGQRRPAGARRSGAFWALLGPLRRAF